MINDIIALLILFVFIFAPALTIILPALGREAGKHKEGLCGVLRDAFKD